ncbi:MAG: hypothetical protein EPN88_01660 [Bacteroidetes bacterium]|nr:MAG: hypothetical protein EPN88_01660 [Bacteroidota bacterium]
MKKLIFLPIFFLVLTLSCKKDNVTPDNTLTPAMARDSLYYIMKEWYYWYNMPEATSVTTSNKGNYSDPYELLDAMRYKTIDRWSFVMDYDKFVATMQQGTFVGHGFRIGLDNTGNARIAMIYSNSPLYANGVRRGWIVKKINDTDIAPILLRGDGAAYTSLIGASTTGVTNKFLFQSPDGGDITITSTKSSFQINSVLLYDTLNLSTGVTGHLVFESFIELSENELATAFAYFSSTGVKDLILDLRYNSGGYLSVAQSLASYIAGNAMQGSAFVKFLYNDKHPTQNSTYPFKTTSYPLGLTRLVVITSRSTASASEAVMNGLKPYLNVVSIGDTTDGKPTGMNGWDIGKKYYMWPVTFKVVNAQNQGEYFDGIFPAKALPDDITRDFNDKEEVCLKEAIHFLEIGSVSTKGGLPFKPAPQFSEKPKWMNNAFVLEK